MFQLKSMNRIGKGALRAVSGLSTQCCASVVALTLLLPGAPLVRADGLVPGGGPSVEEQLEERVTESVEESVVEGAEERLDNLVLGPRGDELLEEQIEEQVEEVVEETISEAIEESTGDVVEELLEDEITDSLEETVEESVEQVIEQSLAQTVAEIMEQVAAQQIEESVEESVGESIEESVEGAVEDKVEEAVAEAVTDSVEESVEETIEEAVAVAVDESVTAAVEESVEAEVVEKIEDSLIDVAEERVEARIDRIIDDLESELEIDESRIQSEQWLVMAEPEVFEELAEQGYLFDEVTELPGLGMRLAEVAAPSSFDITDVRRGVLDVVGKERAEVDLNHIYMAGTHLATPMETGIAPRSAMAFPDDLDQLALRIGMIDSQVDVSHPALESARIQTRSFISEGARAPAFHGTAIASIIAADNEEYRGLAPGAEVYAAAVFEQDPERGEVASTVSLLRALDWLVTAEVEAVNISLAGPPNRLLEAALSRAAKKNVLILAAAGNGGPAAQPMYPAAYGTVIAVTAVDASQKVFRLANRGEYLDLAAPGVGVRHARAGGGYTASSGTSFAVPFAATAAARLRHLQPEEDTVTLLFKATQDLGPPGRDAIYGRGMLHPGG
jgi:subtilisin family serine protease